MDPRATPQADGVAHEDIWDDSALVNSWNEALAEYKKYHGIHATGGILDDPSPEQAKTETRRRHGGGAAPMNTRGEAATHEQPSHRDDKGAGTGAEAGTHATDCTAKDRIDDDGSMASRDAREAPHGLSDANCGASTMPTPHALLDSVQDEGLKRLLMSWYYAGFYTGLHQGQQQRPGQR